ncbi:MAG: tetratricopeptide repeat protein [Acidobacteria bacterium]|nr:tetratricopeptide repeat protein [Acidobacteriota bacterium]
MADGRVGQIFHSALERTGAARAAYLDEVCGADLALLARVRRMLDADGKAQASIEECVAAVSPPIGYAGPYRLLTRIARGGMATVYRAVLDDPEFTQQVAVKIVHGDPAPADLERFRRERQVLARLEHPHIARLIGGGQTDAGQLYAALEYVDGKTLTAHCDEFELPIEARLALFRRVCEAVHYAHRNLVIHRDLKADNIVVNRDGAPKLLDFGIAKLLEPEDTAMETATLERRMTPSYASPEQIRGERVSTATDVWSLGVLLYRLLSGQMPFSSASGDMLELGRQICEATPVLPSQFQPDLAGDLDRIILMALRKEPERRYASVAQLDEDIGRYLAGFPVSAQEDTWKYRVLKFTHRHRAFVTVAVLFLVSLAGFAIAMEQSARRAQRERDTARQVAAFLSQVFQASDPIESRGRELTASEILAAGAERVDRELAGQPEVRGMLLDIIGRTYRGMGQSDKAKALFERSLAVRRAFAGDDSLETAEVLQSLGELRNTTGDYRGAESVLRQSLRIQSRARGNEHFDVANTKNLLGLVLYNLDRRDEAGALLEQASTTLERVAPRDRVYGAALNNLALVRFSQGRLDDGERILHKLVASSRAQFGGDHDSVGAHVANLGGMMNWREKFSEAEPMLREALANRRKLYPNGHAQLAFVLAYLTWTLQNLDKLDEAELLYRELLELRPRVTGPRNRLVARDLAQYADFLRRRGKGPAAEKPADEAVAMLRELASGSHTLAWALLRQGEVNEALQRHPRAVECFREALALFEKAHGKASPFFVAGAKVELARALRSGGQEAEARQLLDQAWVARSTLLQPDDPLVQVVQRAR